MSGLTSSSAAPLVRACGACSACGSRKKVSGPPDWQPKRRKRGAADARRRRSAPAQPWPSPCPP